MSYQTEYTSTLLNIDTTDKQLLSVDIGFDSKSPEKEKNLNNITIGCFIIPYIENDVALVKLRQFFNNHPCQNFTNNDV
ncbi:hypothetical protein PPL_02291 [Heterostelium album PN500]|uniref:Uncharacterized protein n=1 Tax=Heterostelium pallidum (strain ATCC 26659 / Pp 5 / PN500) TaxID=670386 RepID=D3B1W6_HETP5|nr:hypothetical protein PPL_02291 [Heterostelium album PN500]EFA85290.1 hypothetical protein PPL_02291 [Heterostelium album PN500]|eukprot:XP_020437399.1 hypothetical protein PPL_02291 [Heterostelium album PN500]